MSGQSERIPEIHVEDFYEADPGFQALMRRHLDATSMDWARPRLGRMGRLSAGEVDELAFSADDNPPRLEPYDRRGERTERIALHASYVRLKEIAYGEGLVADFYDPEVRRVLGRHAHRVKFALGYLFSQAEQGLYCPVCMTDGAARLVEKFGNDELRARVLAPLASKPPATYWQGAMFLTEKQCGSDVGATDTVARPAGGGTWAITGDKWFCSNAETDVAMVLARPQGAPEGTKGLGLFAMPRRLPDGKLNSYQVLRLKDKLGTRSMPTGEVRLEGAIAWQVGELTSGFHYMTEMLNLSRLYNAVASVSLARRVLREGALYCRSRRSFGRELSSYPMVQETLVGLTLELEGALALVFDTVAALDAYDAGDREARATLRLLTPLVKLSTAKLAIRAASESVELLGGNGYIEDRVTARFFRDAQVLPVWEGTTNILVLDAFRAMKKEGSLALLSSMVDRLARVKSALGPHASAVEAEARAVAGEGKSLVAASGDGLAWTLEAKPWCFRAARLLEAVLLAEAAATGGEREQSVAQAFADRLSGEGRPQKANAAELARQYEALV